LQASNDLQLKMKHGSVSTQDFHNPGALWGYCQHKMTKRALLAFEAFRIGSELVPKILHPEQLVVASVGGGCGNDLYGFTLFRDLCCSQPPPPTTTHDDTLLLFDFVSEDWSPIVHKLGECLSRPIQCLPCDVQQPLVGVERNDNLLRECEKIDVFTFSFVLHEAQDWTMFLSELWTRAKDGALFYFKDPSNWQEKKILKHFEHLEWVEGHDYFWVLGDGLLLVKRCVVERSSGANKEDCAVVVEEEVEVEEVVVAVEVAEGEEEKKNSDESLPYAGEEYWNKRYDAHSDAYDWLIEYSHFKEQGLDSFIQSEDNILMLGCGNATFSPDLYDDGYCHIHNIDLSPTVIQQMSEEHKQKISMTWKVMDCCQLSFDNESFDVVLDKSTMDCLCCCENSVHQISTMMKESWRCLCPGGLFISLSFHDKERVVSCIQYDEEGSFIGWSDVECFLIPNPKVERGEEATPANYVCVVAIKPS
jgi:ubiquinone/menaquinone biosynthesis C-methylase UbiE